MSLSKFTEQNYLDPTKPSGGCAIQKNSYSDKSTLHERCVCSGKGPHFCNPLCDEDLNCKGYATGNAGHNICAFATTSNCTKECKKYGSGNVGSLRIGDQYGAKVYAGCYTKSQCHK